MVLAGCDEYNAARFGGTTTMELDITDPKDAGCDASRFKGQWVSIPGTSTNCAGASPIGIVS